MITRDELKNELINIGVSEQLLEMPAVLEHTQELKDMIQKKWKI